jgi:pimeloyl-ACP methyl ester carboxylesterase
MRIFVLLMVVLVAALLTLQGCATMRAEKAAPPIGQFVEVEGERIHLVDIPAADGGTGAPVVLIHGASVNLRDMKIALADALSAHHRVVIVDRPGRGYSTRPKEGWRLATQARLINGALAELGVQKPVILGQSYGSAVALAYALEHQDEMTALVLLTPVSHPWPGGVTWYNSVSGWPVAGALLRRLVIPLYGPHAARKGVVSSFAPDPAPEGYYDNSGLALVFRPRDFRANAADLRHLKAEIVAMAGRYSEIGIPTAILTGTDDRTVSNTIHAAALVRMLPNVTLEEVPDTGHAIHHAETARIVAAIERVSRQ